MHYYQFRIAEWMLSTAHLTLEEEGVYRRLIDHYYDTEEPIPEETKPVIRRLRLKGYEETVAEILEEFFVLQDGFWHHKRCDKEIEDYKAKAEQARENGKRGGRPPKKPQQKQGGNESKNPEETQPVSSANPEESEPKANQEPETNNQEPETSSNDSDKPVSSPQTPAAVLIPTNKFNTKGEEFPITDQQISDWQEIYPAVNVLQTVKQIRSWNLSNPSKRKTYRGVAAHVDKWLAREQNKGGTAGGQASAAAPVRKPKNILDEYQKQQESNRG